MHQFLKKHLRELTFSAVIIVCLLLIFVALLLLREYNDVLKEQAGMKVNYYISDLAEQLNDATANLQSVADLAAVALRNAASVPDAAAKISQVRETSLFANDIFFRFFREGKEYSDNGLLFDQSGEDKAVLYAMEQCKSGVGKAACIGVVYDSASNQKRIAFCSPTSEATDSDVVILFCPIGTVKNAVSSLHSEYLGDSEFVAVCSAADGYILEVLYAEDAYNLYPNANVFDILEEALPGSFTNLQQALSSRMKNHASGTFTESATNGSYQIAVGSASSGSGLCLVGLYQSATVYSSGYQYVQIVVVSLIILFLILILLSVYLIVSRRIMSLKIAEFGMIDERLGCPTKAKFEKDAVAILQRYKGTRFALVSMDFKYFDYITEQYGEKKAEEILQLIQLFLRKSLRTGEIYGYVSGSEHVLLLHYKETDALIRRLNQLYALVCENPIVEKYNIQLRFGIYEISETDGTNIPRMIEKAVLAKDNMTSVNAHTNLFKEGFLDQYLQNADIEAKMDAALSNDEFKVFFQPKYHLQRSCMDGCEALIRWYDPEKEEYRAPATFLPLFEANGFIVKLDYRVYYRVCEFIGARIADRRKVPPVSVNVSRVTALQPDFVDYYVKIKKKFQIPDGLITIEVTESVAYENYDQLNAIVRQLHQNGFLCSIDDFGTGYSSYHLLKVLNIDEIKLDKFFLGRGIDGKRDQLILESVIRLGRQLKIKIIQEGVETQDELDFLRTLGCDVIQGYYYSKPLTMADFARFIDQKEQEKESLTVSAATMDLAL